MKQITLTHDGTLYVDKSGKIALCKSPGANGGKLVIKVSDREIKGWTMVCQVCSVDYHVHRMFGSTYDEIVRRFGVRFWIKVKS